MRLKWFQGLNHSLQVLVLAGLLLFFTTFYISLSKYLNPVIVSLISLPLKFCEQLSANAKQFLRFQDLVEENKRLRGQMQKLTQKALKLQESSLENERLRKLLSLPQSSSFKTETCLVIGKDSSNWTRTVMINKGRRCGIKTGMPCVLGTALVGHVTEVAPAASKVALIVDFNSKIPALIQRTREEAVAFGTLTQARGVCKLKYIQQGKIGDRVITSGLGKVYPKGLLIGEVVGIEEEQHGLYKVAQILPAVEFSALEEVMVITSY